MKDWQIINKETKESICRTLHFSVIEHECRKLIKSDTYKEYIIIGLDGEEIEINDCFVVDN